MLYRIIETTDGQHRGKTIEASDESMPMEFVDGDDTIEFENSKILGPHFIGVSPNYIVIAVEMNG